MKCVYDLLIKCFCIGHLANDVLPFFSCCWGAFKSCKHYYDRRPNDDCSEWPNRPPPGNINYDSR